MMVLKLNESMMEGGISFDVGKMQPLLNKHKGVDGVCMETGMLEGNCVICVTTTQKYPFNSNGRT